MGLCLSKKRVDKQSSGSGDFPSAAPHSAVHCSPKIAVAAASVESQEVGVGTPLLKEKENGKKKENPVSVPTSDEEEAKEKAPRRSYKAVKESDDSCGGGCSVGGASAVRTSSCTKEELDAILIQCGRLSRSSSGKGGSSAENHHHPRRYSGSKRSYDFDTDGQGFGKGDDERAQRSAATPVHRRNSSRDRDGSGRRSHLKRSSSAGDEGRRGGSSGDRRRTSRSPRRRSDTPTTDNSKRPARMVSVPATTSTAKKVISASPAQATTSAQPLKRGVEAARSAASPRSRSPAPNSSRAAPSAASNENAAPQPSLSRSSSRKAEQSPLRRNPMSEIDDNAANIRSQHLAPRNQYDSNNQKPNLAYKVPLNNSKQVADVVDKTTSHMLVSQKSNHNVAHIQRSGERVLESCDSSNNSTVTSKGIREQLISCRAADQQPQLKQEIMEERIYASQKQLESERVVPGVEALNPITLTRSRSSRRSRDLDLLLNPSAFASLLMEDAQNLSQHEAIGFSLPPCVTKACSIVEAVADLNSCANSTLSTTSTGGKNTPDADRTPNHRDNLINGLNGGFADRKMWVEKKNHSFVESEVALDHNDLVEPSLHKYVTVRDVGGADMEQQESAGSNSFFFLSNGCHNDWSGGGGASVSSSWEPNSADSTDRWTTSLSKAAEVEQQQILNEIEVQYNNSSEGAADGRRRMQSAAAETVTTSRGSESGKREPERATRGVGNQNAKPGIRTSSRRTVVVASQ